jgi:uncharacterized protein (DUF2384 family)
MTHDAQIAYLERTLEDAVRVIGLISTSLITACERIDVLERLAVDAMDRVVVLERRHGDRAPLRFVAEPAEAIPAHVPTDRGGLEKGSGE